MVLTGGIGLGMDVGDQGDYTRPVSEGENNNTNNWRRSHVAVLTRIVYSRFSLEFAKVAAILMLLFSPHVAQVVEQ